MKIKHTDMMCTAYSPPSLQKKRHGKAIAIMWLCIAGFGFTILASDIPIWYITVTPQNYTIQFKAWCNPNYNIYTPEEIASMNRFNVTLYGNCDDFYGSAALWLANAPNVKLIRTVYSQSLEGSFVWDGNSDDVIARSKMFVQEMMVYNYSNVKGLVFDWENPVSHYEKTWVYPSPDDTRHQQSITAWNEYFAWLHDYAPHLEMVHVNWIMSSYDANDGDYDLHNALAFNTFQVPYWSAYEPMIYRAWYTGQKPFGDPEPFVIEDADPFGDTQIDTTYEFYLKVKRHVEGTYAQVHDMNKIGAILGITNSSCYRNGPVYEFGQYFASGFDVLARDVRICKSFGMPSVSFFLLNSANENGYTMGGAFASYGSDFFDQLNTSVNSEAALQPFKIPVGRLIKYITDMELCVYPLYDFWLSIVKYGWILVGCLIGLIGLKVYRKTQQNRMHGVTCHRDIAHGITCQVPSSLSRK